MLKLLVLLTFIICVFSNCQKDTFDRIEVQVEGTWEFTSASQRSYHAFSGHQSIFSHYEGDLITFEEDKTVYYTESNGDELEGIWDIRSVDGVDSEGDNVTEYIISIALVDQAGALIQYVWEVQNTLINRRLKVEESTSDYEYCYELAKW
jgi:hypothetical protein